PAAAEHERAVPGGIDEHLISLTAPNSPEAEQYRNLRMVLEAKAVGKDCYVVGVSSPSTGDGKTLTAINLAGALAQAEKTRILVMDADLRGSAVAEQLGLSRSAARGLIDLVRDPGLSLDEVIQPCLPNLAILPAGRGQGSPYEVLSSPRLADVVDAVRARYDYVVVDTPPLLPISDSRLIARCVDGILVVVAAHRTAGKVVEESLRELDVSKLLGFVFNAADAALPGGYYYSHQFSSRNGHSPHRSRIAQWLRRK
ncbi:MAG: CpsD/CapB family tyrosine-protein kinase, partial [Candidatus Binatia bacterium]